MSHLRRTVAQNFTGSLNPGRPVSMVRRRSHKSPLAQEATPPPAAGKRIALVDGAHYMKETMSKVLSHVYKDQALHFDTSPKPWRHYDLLIFSVFGLTHVIFPRRIKRVLICCEPEDIQSRDFDFVIDCKVGSWMKVDRRPSHYLPFYVTSFGERNPSQQANQLLEAQPIVLSEPRKNFCSFLYSHSVEFRDNFYHALNELRTVVALGRCPVDDGRQDRVPIQRTASGPSVGGADRSQEGYMDRAASQMSSFRFAIAIENTRIPGYVTEKIVNAYLAGCIPIYLGAPDIEDHFRADSFVNIANFSSLEEAAEYVVRLDDDPVRMATMLANRPPVTDLARSFFDLSKVADAMTSAGVR